MSPAVWWNFAVITWIGGWLIKRLTMRVAGQMLLCRWLVISYGLRVALALVLFTISYWHLPILRALQWHPPGFWTFAVDASVYHYYGSQIASAWLAGLEIPATEGLGIESFAVVAALYTFLGSHPLYPAVVNCLFGALSGLLAFAISRRISGERTAIVSGLLVGFWPSTLICSSQLLKDSLSLFLTLAVLLLIVQACAAVREPRRVGILRLVAWGLALISSVVLLTKVRFYLGSVLSLTALAICLPAAASAAARRRVDVGAGYLALAALVAVSALFGRGLDTARLLTPAHPERGHFRLGMALWKAGDFNGAAGQFRTVLSLDPRYGEAYLALAAADIPLGNYDEALRAYEAYLEQEQDPQRRAHINSLIAQVCVQHADSVFGTDYFHLAPALYEKALALEPHSTAVVEHLALALAGLGRFEEAVARTQQALGMAATPQETQRIHQALGRIYAAKGDSLLREERFREAQEAFERALGLAPDTAVYAERLALALARQEQFEEALVVARTAQQMGSNAVEETEHIQRTLGQIYEAYGHHLLEQERMAEAQTAYEQARAMAASSPYLYQGLALALAGQGQFEKAIAMAKKGLGAASEGYAPAVYLQVQQALGKIYSAQGDLALQEGNFSAAKTFYLEAISQGVYLHPSLSANLALALAGQGSVAPVKASVQLPRELAAEALAIPPLESKLLPIPLVREDAGSKEYARRFATQQTTLMEHAQAAFSMAGSHTTPRSASDTGPTAAFASSLRQLDEEALSTVQETTPTALGGRRGAFVEAGGHSLMDPRAMIAQPGALLRYLPRALAIGLLSPFPWQWFDTKGSTGIMRTFAGLEMVFLYLLLPAMWVGTRKLVASRRVEAYVLLAWILLTAVPLSLVVANVGTLFRLRLAFVLPLLIVAAEGKPLDMCSRLIPPLVWLRGTRSGSLDTIGQDKAANLGRPNELDLQTVKCRPANKQVVG